MATGIIPGLVLKPAQGKGPLLGTGEMITLPSPRPILPDNAARRQQAPIANLDSRRVQAPS